MDALVATALTAQLDHTPHRPTIAERAARVDWEKVDAILARVPAAPPTPGDERQPVGTWTTSMPSCTTNTPATPTNSAHGKAPATSSAHRSGRRKRRAAPRPQPSQSRSLWSDSSISPTWRRYLKISIIRSVTFSKDKGFTTSYLRGIRLSAI